MLFDTTLSLLALCAVAVDARNPKRGLISDLASTTYTRDANLLTSPNVKAISWYYSFGHYPDPKFSEHYEFVMQQFGVNETPEPDGNNFKNIKTLMAEVDKTKPSHLMTFLEPTGYGVSVDAGVAAWKKYIIPIQKKYPKLRIGSPQMINGDASAPWMKEFIKKCPECHFDFLDLHFYWTANELKGFVEGWHNKFPKLPVWVSDIGFQGYTNNGGTDGTCKVGDKRCVGQIENAVKWMDSTPWIARYTYRGEFAPSSNRGEKVQPLWSFITDKGTYTNLGKYYLNV